jgi:hypothetical protein
MWSRRGAWELAPTAAVAVTPEGGEVDNSTQGVMRDAAAAKRRAFAMQGTG